MKNNNKVFKPSKLFISLTSIVSVLSFGATIATSISLNKTNIFSNSELNSNNLSNNANNNINNGNNTLNSQNTQNKDVADVKPLIVNETNYFNPRLSSKNGPILFWKDEITSVDWFGAERWKIDVSTLKDESGSLLFVDFVGSWIRKWLNFDLDKKNDILYILSNGGTRKQQVIVAIDVASGQHIKTYRTISTTDGNNNRYFGLSVLENGNVLVYCKQGNVVSQSDLIDVKTGKITQNNGNLSSIATNPTKGTRYLMNLIPIGNNRNLAMTYILTTKSGTIDDKGYETDETSQVEFFLCDDNMKVIDSASSDWKKPRLVTKAITGTRNSAIWPQRDWYKLLDGRVVTVIYDKLVIIDGTNQNNPSFTTYTLDNDKWIESWSFDTNEKLYFKSKNNSIIQTVTLDPTKGNNHTKSTYYDLQNSNEQIKKYANNFTLFNVYGYSGQVMLINPYFNKYVNAYKQEGYPNEQQMKDNQYGLAAAITNNKNNVGQGDTKGLLNTVDAFQKSADFTINEEILRNKLPSEISRNDLTLQNQSFFTLRTEIENGELKYNPFIKTKMDDNSKELEVTVNLDQIPWFVTNNTMPDGIKPLKLVKKFSSLVDIESRFKWKNSDVDDYDFKNTLPSKVTIEDIERISPLVSTLSSKSTTINGQKYPKTQYKIEEKDDINGTIKISATYKYLPIDTLEKEENIKEYKLEKKFNIFKNSNVKNFSFVSENGSSSGGTANINNIPALKELKEANLFPSHFQNSNNKQEFLKFIDINKTSGYPLEKMNITVNADDNNGTLTVNVDPRNYDNSLSLKTITYIGLNKKNSYDFNFISNPANFEKKKYRPSDITNEILFKNFINYSGFDSSDLKISLNPNNENGNLIIDVSFNVSYPESVLIDAGFTSNNGIYKRTQTITGFKTNSEFNNEYQLNFKDDSDNSLMKIKELTPATIKANLESSNGLTVGTTKYSNIYELANLFILSKGTNIPEITQANSSKVNIQMFTNNSGGEITFDITFSSLSNYSNSITFIQKFSGFAKGNDVITNDVLTFKDSNQLKITEKELLKKRPSEVLKELKTNKSMITKFLSGRPTGSYKTAIDSQKFELKITADDNYGILTINIKFNRIDITNKDSLLEYSQTFTGFNSF